MRWPVTASRRGPPVPGHSRRRRALVVAALGTLGGLGLGWGVRGRPTAVVNGAASGGANLLVNGSFEQPAGYGLMTLGPPTGWWQRFGTWWRANSEINRAAIGRRQPPVYVPFPSPAPELTGWRIFRGTVDLVGPAYWQQAPGQGRQNVDQIGSPGAATIQQTFATDPGREYTFSGWLSHNPVLYPALARRANVFLNDRFLVQLVHGDPRTTQKNMRWRRFSYPFRATSGRTTLKLTDVTAASGNSLASDMAVRLCGTVIDGLSVTPVARSRSRR